MVEYELIISTYNSPHSLAACLRSLLCQSSPLQSICIADDGSGADTKKVVVDFANETQASVRHVWHDDEGFRKGKILNDAVKSSKAEYLIFIDGDVVVHRSFVERHLSQRAKNRFLVGTMIRLGDNGSRLLENSPERYEQAFSTEWLRENAESFGLTDYLKSKPWPVEIMTLLERTIVPPRRSLGGCNCSMFRNDFLRVNGYNESLKYGGQDKELGERLKNAGLRPKSVRYTTPLLHLFHGRPYNKSSGRKLNRDQIIRTRRSGCLWTDQGVVKGGDSAE